MRALEYIKEWIKPANKVIILEVSFLVMHVVNLIKALYRKDVGVCYNDH